MPQLVGAANLFGALLRDQIPKEVSTVRKRTKTCQDNGSPIHKKKSIDHDSDYMSIESWKGLASNKNAPIICGHSTAENLEIPNGEKQHLTNEFGSTYWILNDSLESKNIENHQPLTSSTPLADHLYENPSKPQVSNFREDSTKHVILLKESRYFNANPAFQIKPDQTSNLSIYSPGIENP